MSGRSQITAGLSKLLERHLSKGSERWGKEVRIWSPTECRVDYMSISCPNGAFAGIGSIEAATLACYEVKSCMADYKSGSGLSALGDANWIVCPDELRRKLVCDEEPLSPRWGVASPCPSRCRSFNDPIPYEGEVEGWRLHFFDQRTYGNRTIPIAQAMWAILCGGAK